MKKRIEASTSIPREVSESGVKQLILAYRSDKNGAVAADFRFRPGMIYSCVRAISARVNQNYDGWPSEELKKSYRTFIGKPIFVNHNNYDPSRARGRVVAARYVDAGNGDKYIETVMEVDAQRFPKLAHELRTGGLDGVSMGVEAGFTKCSICDRKATDLFDMCDHVKFHKGEYLRHAKTGKRTLCFENCFKLGFFELSYVFDPADETAVVSKVLIANKKQAMCPSCNAPEHWYLDTDHPAPPGQKKIKCDNCGHVRIVHGEPDPETAERLRKQYPRLSRTKKAQCPPNSPNCEVGGLPENQADDKAKTTTNYMGDYKHAPGVRDVSGYSYQSGGGDGNGGGGGGSPSSGKPATPSSLGGGGKPSGGPPSKDLNEALSRAGIDPAMYPLISGFSAAEGNNPSGAPTLGFTDSQAGTTLDEHAQALAQQIQDRESVAGPFPGANASPQEQASWMADVVGQQGVPSDWQGNAQPPRQEYVDRVVTNMPRSGRRTADKLHHTDWRQVGYDAFNEGGPADPQHHHVVTKALRHLPPRHPEAQRVHEEYRRGYQAAERENMPQITPDQQEVGLGGYPGGYQWHQRKTAATSHFDPATAPRTTRPGGEKHKRHPMTTVRGPSYDRSWGHYLRNYGDKLRRKGIPEDDVQEMLEEIPYQLQAVARKIRNAKRIHGYGEIEAPEAVNTLRNEEEEEKDDFHHYLQSPPELQDPDLEASRERIQGERGGRPTMSHMTGRRRYAADEDDLPPEEDESFGGPEDSDDAGPPPEEGGGEADPIEAAIEDFLGWCEENAAPPSQDALDQYASEAQLDDETYGILQQVVDQVFGGADQGAAPEDVGAQGPPPGGGGEEIPPELLQQTARRQSGKGNTMGRGSLAERGRVASRGRRQHYAADNGYTDGSPYGRNDQGEQENVFLTPTPSPDAVEAPTDDESNISNTENSLVAMVRRQTADLKRSTAALQRLRSSSYRYAEEGEPHGGTGALPGPTDNSLYGGGSATGTFGTGMGGGSAQEALKNSPGATPGSTGYVTTGPPFGGAGQQLKGGRRYAADGGLPDATQVNPELSGTEDQDLKGDSFEALQPDKVETQPKDASIHAFAAFDNWLRQTTGRTATQHNANFLRRQAIRWASAQGCSVEVLFPTLRNALREARKAERSGHMYRTADEKLEVAAPDARVDTETPVKDVTDQEAQSSQFDLGDFGNNAGDDLADPDLSTDSQIWAPGKSANKKADAVAAVRCAEAYIKAGLTPEQEKWKLIAQFQTMRHATVVDRTRLLEAVIQATASRRVTAGVSRGTVPRSSIPVGFTSGSRRVASQTRTAANDPAFDCTLFI